MNLSEFVEEIYVINLARRADRRRSVLCQLGSIGLSSSPKVEIFSALEPAEKGDFASIAARGCTLSHLSVLQKACRSSKGHVLILEDDVTFDPNAIRHIPRLLDQLKSLRWGLAYLGHFESSPDKLVTWRLFQHDIIGAHCYLVHRDQLESVSAFMERSLKLPPGHPSGACILPDGVLNHYRREYPEVQCYLAQPSVAAQGAFASDISPKVFDRIPVVSWLAGFMRKMRRLL